MSQPATATTHDLYAMRQEVTERMTDSDRLPVTHHVYRETDDGTWYVRLCDETVRSDRVPFSGPPLAEGWDDLGRLGEGASCADCATEARRLLGLDDDG